MLSQLFDNKQLDPYAARIVAIKVLERRGITPDLATNYGTLLAAFEKKLNDTLSAAELYTESRAALQAGYTPAKSLPPPDVTIPAPPTERTRFLCTVVITGDPGNPATLERERRLLEAAQYHH
jgi:hypothetical protein